MKDFLELMDGKGWIYTLEKGDEGLHPLPEVEKASKKEEQRGKERKVGKVGEGLIKGKAFVQEIIKVSHLSWRLRGRSANERSV